MWSLTKGAPERCQMHLHLLGFVLRLIFLLARLRSRGEVAIILHIVIILSTLRKTVQYAVPYMYLQTPKDLEVVPHPK